MRAALITLIGAFIAHSVAATMYYLLNRVRLLVAADTAVRAGGEYLPSNPHWAMTVTEGSLKENGVIASEIAFADISPDRRTLTIRLSVKDS
jgi:hypothetical protein